MLKTKRVQLILLISFSCSMASDEESKSFSPGNLWLDIDGVPINAHGGGVLFHNNKYYCYGEHKVEGKAGNKAQVGVRVYSSGELYQWKNEVWKDGIANIDEQLNGLKPRQYSYLYSKHAEAINTIQKWFVEETRLGIPVDFNYEGIHGLNHEKATPLPSLIAIGSTWDKNLVRQAGEIVGKALGYTNIYAPILDLARDPRWGRVVEC